MIIRKVIFCKGIDYCLYSAEVLDFSFTCRFGPQSMALLCRNGCLRKQDQVEVLVPGCVFGGD